jgi:hypothetical protein
MKDYIWCAHIKFLCHKHVLLSVILFIFFTYSGSTHSQQPESLTEQVQQQIDAYKNQSQMDKLVVTAVQKMPSYRLWTATEKVEDSWVTSLSDAYKVFKKAIGDSETIDIVLVDTPLDAARIDNAQFETSPLILPIATIKAKGLSRTTTVEAVIRHEACHKWLISYANSIGVQHKSNNIGIPVYGHGALPDWLDEAVAIMCENPELKSTRLELTEFMPFEMERFLTMEHPVYEQIKSVLNAKKSSQATQTKVLQLASNDVRKIDYYRQSALFKSYLFSTLDSQVLRSIIQAIAQGTSATAYLQTALNTQSIEEIDSDFIKYVQSL